MIFYISDLNSEKKSTNIFRESNNNVWKSNSNILRFTELNQSTILSAIYIIYEKKKIQIWKGYV